MFPGLEKGLCVPFFKSRGHVEEVYRVFVYFDRDSQTVFAEDSTKLLLNQICLSRSCFGNSETIISVQTKITRITETPLLSGTVDMRQQVHTIRRCHNYPW